MPSHNVMIFFEVPLLSSHRDRVCSCFFDRDGKCMTYPIFKYSAEYQEAFTEKFHSENSYPDHVTDVTAVFVAKIKTSEYCIVGWHRLF